VSLMHGNGPDQPYLIGPSDGVRRSSDV